VAGQRQACGSWRLRIFYDTTNLRLLSQVIRQNGSNVLSYTITPASARCADLSEHTREPAGTLTKPTVTTLITISNNPDAAGQPAG